MPPKPIIAAVREAEKAIAVEIAKARKLARAGADPATVLAPVNAARNTMQRSVTSLVNRAGNAGSTAVADAARLPTVWVAETNACVTCLAYSGVVAKPGKAFPAGRTYGKRSTVTTLTISGGTVYGGTTALTAATPETFMYVASESAWYRSQ